MVIKVAGAQSTGNMETILLSSTLIIQEADTGISRKTEHW
jgi:hypothetical protein